jgi:molecular chaperone DnaK (HSP70)
MDRTRRLTEEALEEAGLSWGRLHGVLLVGGSTRMPMVRSYVSQMAGAPPRAGVNVDEVVALGAAIHAAELEGFGSTDAVPKFTLGGRPTPQFFLPGARRVRDVMSHSLGAIAISSDGSAYVNDVVIRRNLAIPAQNTRSYLHATHGGANQKLEVYITQGESVAPLDCSVLGKYVFSGIEPTAADVTIDLEMSYDANGVVQVNATQRDTGATLAMAIEPVPDDLSWLGRPPDFGERSVAPDPVTVYLLIDVSASMAGGPLLEAQSAARAFLEKCDFTSTQVGLIAFSDQVTLMTDATDHVRRIQSGIDRLEADGSTNLTDALELARERLTNTNRTRYVVILTDGFPDAPESAVEQAEATRAIGVEIVVIGTGAADIEYLRRLSSTDAGTIFARQGELVGTFGHIARVIAEGGRALRMLS